MDIGDLIKAAPDLMSGLGNLGLSEDKIGNLAGEVSNQLGGGDGFDFSDLLSGLNSDSFLSKLDIGSIAEKVGISPEIAQSAIGLIAPMIANFSADAGGLGKVAGLAKGLFGGKG